MTTSHDTALTDTPATSETPAVEHVSGLYSVSIRQAGNREEMRAAAYAQAGLAVDGLDQDRVVLPDAYTQTGFTVTDLVTLIENLHALATDPASIGREAFEPFGEGSDSEDRPTTQFMFGLGGRTGEENWLACVEAVHAVWPHLIDTLGASVGAQVFPGDDADARRTVHVPELRVPKVLRLKGGWDYDAEGNQVWLPLEEAWRRFVALNETRSRDDIGYMNSRTLRRMRRHMKSYYKGKETTRP